MVEQAATARKSSARRWSIAAGIIVIGVSWLVADALGRNANDKPGGKGKGGQPTSVAVATAKTGDLDIYIDALGTAVPLNSVLVRSRVDGELMRVHFREGQDVKAGDLLAEIDPRPFTVQLAQARGKLARDEALLKNARTDVERYQTLWSQDSISRQELDTQLALVQQYEGAVISDRGEVDSAELQLTYAHITAPVSGRIGLRQVDPGNIVHASDEKGLLLITQVDPIAVVFSVPEDRITAIARRNASGATLIAEAWDRERVQKLGTGRLASLDNQIDVATGTVKLKALFENNTGKAGDGVTLFPNQFVNVRLLVDTIKDTTLIPLDAVQRGSKGTFVYQLQDDKTVNQQLIEIRESVGDSVSVSKGIAPGVRVVVDGTDKLRDGAKVTVIDRPLENGFDKPPTAADKNSAPQLTQRQTP